MTGTATLTAPAGATTTSAGVSGAAAGGRRRPRLLCVCEKFWPQTSPTAIRSSELVRRLARTWDVEVVTHGSAEAPGDEAMTLRRVDAPRTGQIREWLAGHRLGRLGELLPLAGPFAGWRRAATSAALGAIEARRPDAVAVFLMPYASGDVAMAIKGRTGLPVLVNLDDSPTCSDMHEAFPSGWHYRRTRAWEDRLVRTADAAVYVAAFNRDRVAARQPSEVADRLHVVRYGVTVPAEGSGGGRVERRVGRAFTVRYLGGMSGWSSFYDAPGATPWAKRLWKAANGWGERRLVRLDHRGSSPYFVCRALDRLAEAGRVGEGEAAVEVIGNRYPQHFIDRALKHGRMARWTSVRPPLPHAECMRLMHDADCLFLCLPGRADGSAGGRISAKTYEYLLTDRPILAALPRGENRDFLAEAPGVWHVDPSDDAGMAAALGEMMSLRSRGADRFDRSAMRAALDYDALAGQFDVVLRSLVPAERGGTR